MLSIWYGIFFFNNFNFDKVKKFKEAILSDLEKKIYLGNLNL